MAKLHLPEPEEYSLTSSDIERVAQTLRERLSTIQHSSFCIRMVAEALLAHKNGIPSGDEVYLTLKRLSDWKSTQEIARKALAFGPMPKIARERRAAKRSSPE